MKCSIFLFLVTTVNSMFLDSYNTTVEYESPMNVSKVLSRKKRFLVFPDGSSFQLVFCTQTHGYLQVGDIVWFGNTAALAWELPSDPKLFYMLKHKEHGFGNRRMDSSKHILYLDEYGKVVGKVPYKRKPIVNPAFAKRSIDEKSPKRLITSIKNIHDNAKTKNIFKNLDEDRVEFHRFTRKIFYGKIEKVLEGLGWNGRECVLRFLCETGKGNEVQGSFIEEILRSTFTLPQGKTFDTKSANEYDIAHRSQEDCAKLYRNCAH